MNTAITPAQDDARLMEQVLLKGDLKDLSPTQRVSYYRKVCESLGLNPLTKPFDYITLNNRLTLYAKRDATDQLRRLHGISIQIVSRDQIGDLLVVTARATTSAGMATTGELVTRADESIGAVSTVGLKGEALANSMMKAETKAKRRVTLSIAGLGWLDESEAASVPEGAPANVDTETGEVVASEKPPADAHGSGGDGHAAPDGPKEGRKEALGRLQAAVSGSGLNKKAVFERASTLFGRELHSTDGMTDEEISGLADEVEAVIAATKP